MQRRQLKRLTLKGTPSAIDPSMPRSSNDITGGTKATSAKNPTHIGVIPEKTDSHFIVGYPRLGADSRNSTTENSERLS